MHKLPLALVAISLIAAATVLQVMGHEGPAKAAATGFAFVIVGLWIEDDAGTEERLEKRLDKLRGTDE